MIGITKAGLVRLQDTKWVNSLFNSFLFPSHCPHTCIFLRHKSLLRLRLLNIFPKSEPKKKNLRWVSGQRNWKVSTRVTPSQCLLVTWLVCLISGKANKSSADKYLLRSQLHSDNKPVRSMIAPLPHLPNTSLCSLQEPEQMPPLLTTCSIAPCA